MITTYENARAIKLVEELENELLGIKATQNYDMPQIQVEETSEMVLTLPVHYDQYVGHYYVTGEIQGTFDGIYPEEAAIGRVEVLSFSGGDKNTFSTDLFYYGDNNNPNRVAFNGLYYANIESSSAPTVSLLFVANMPGSLQCSIKDGT